MASSRLNRSCTKLPGGTPCHQHQYNTYSGRQTGRARQAANNRNRRDPADAASNRPGSHPRAAAAQAIATDQITLRKNNVPAFESSTIGSVGDGAKSTANN